MSKTARLCAVQVQVRDLEAIVARLPRGPGYTHSFESQLSQARAIVRYALFNPLDPRLQRDLERCEFRMRQAKLQALKFQRSLEKHSSEHG